MTSLIHLQAIEKFKWSELENEMIAHAISWNKERKCDCVKILKNRQLKILLSAY